MKIALFDYRVTSGNAIGKCNLNILSALCREYDFTVFSVAFENPCPERIRWVRIPSPQRPLALLFLTFHLLAPLCYWWHRIWHRTRYDIIQMVESNLLFGDIVYSHFCHRAYLRNHWRATGASGIRGFFRWLDHWLHAAVEPWTYRRARQIVVPSLGLARELTREYSCASSKIVVVPNPVDVDRMSRPEDFNVDDFRCQLGFSREDLLLAFVALGQYERKGLPLLLDALVTCGDSRFKLIVVGGTEGLVEAYKKRISRMGLAKQVVFAGTQRDVRPYLWASDALALTSYYEVFPLVALEAAAAGLPLIVTPLNGVEEFLRDGENGILVKREPQDICSAISRFFCLPAFVREEMGRQARTAVSRYKPASFAAAWARNYQDA